LLVVLDGSLDGAGGVGGTPQVTLSFAGLLDGAGFVSGDPGFNLLLGGQVVGVGSLYDGGPDLAGALMGVGEATLSGPIGVVNLLGLGAGSGDVQESVPLPVWGLGSLTGFLEIETVPPPICCCCCVGPTTFSWGQAIDGRLTLCVTNAIGQPYAPEHVSYALYFVRGQARFLVGSASRVPVPDGVGCYHATGFLGDCGQPGSWVIVWTYCAGGSLASVEQPFEVVAGPGVTNLCGCAKYGWE
jgi:hypothetical protein